ncbi:MAG: NAD(P)H-dependent oxidoreductase subunit E [Planctomycetes bacterium]|nr:NAD(P)H-dependent oxidoreductase subunit E [Planctomycetota bacterium]
MSAETKDTTISSEALEAMKALTKRFPEPDGALLTALRIAEREIGFINAHVCEQVAGAIGMPPAKVWGVVSFYSTFRRDTDGKYIIYVCSTLPCALRGSEKVFDYVADKLGIKNGETTPDSKFTLRKAECLGSCGTAPCLQVNQDEYYEDLDFKKIDEILEDLGNDKSPARHHTV